MLRHGALWAILLCVPAGALLQCDESLLMGMLRATQELHPESLQHIAKHVWRTLRHYPHRGGACPSTYGSMDAFWW